MGTFICHVPCWHGGHKFKKGESFIGNSDELPKNKDGELRHFVESLNQVPDPIKVRPTMSPVVIVNSKSPSEIEDFQGVKKKANPQDLP